MSSGTKSMIIMLLLISVSSITLWRYVKPINCEKFVVFDKNLKSTGVKVTRTYYNIVYRKPSGDFFERETDINMYYKTKVGDTVDICD